MKKGCSVDLRKNEIIVIDDFRVGKGPRQLGFIRVLGSNASSNEIGETVQRSLEAFREYSAGFNVSRFDTLTLLKKKFKIKSWRAYYKTVLYAFSVSQENDSVLIYPLLKSGAGYVFDDENKQYLPLDSDAIGRYLSGFRKT